MAKSILERITTTVHLSHVLIKHILGLPLVLQDLKRHEESLFNSMVFIQNHSVEENEYLKDQQFVVQVTAGNGLYQDRELMKNGQSMTLDDSNKGLFVEKMVEFHLCRKMEVELNIFLYEFYEVIPKSLVEIFSEAEFEMLLNGMDEIDLKDWKKHTHYKGAFSEKHKTVRWFWKIVEEELTNAER